MRRGKPTRLGTVLLIIISAAVLISGLFWVGRTLFSGDGATEADNLSVGQKLLQDPNDKTAVRMSVRGPVAASENHYSIVITINQSEREITTFRGYQGEIIKNQQLENNQAAFRDLLAALERAGYATENKAIASENQGVCAVGQLIQFEILDGEKSVQKLWTTSCGQIVGSFAGMAMNVESLFIGQIPNARAIINDAKRAVR